jgi:hypothetical protein
VTEFSDIMLLSSDSSPLDTPEIDQQALEQEHEVLQQLADNEESLSGAPDPSSNTLPLFNNSCVEKEDSEEIDNFQSPPAILLSPP